MKRHVTNKVIINLKRRNCTNFLKPLIKKNIKYTKFNQFLNYYPQIWSLNLAKCLEVEICQFECDALTCRAICNTLYCM